MKVLTVFEKERNLGSGEVDEIARILFDILELLNCVKITKNIYHDP